MTDSTQQLGYKAEALAKVLNDAKDAKTIEGMPNTYDPENYSKLYRANRAIADLEDTDYLIPQIDEGAFEWDKAHNRLKSISRYAPAMLDLAVFTANLYKKDSRGRVEDYEVEEEKEDKAGKKVKKTVIKHRVSNDTVLTVIFGRATVQAIREMKEIGNAVKAHVFVKKEGGDWIYEGDKLIKKDDAYNFASMLEPKSALKLLRMIQQNVTNEAITGDKLDDVA